MPSALLLLFFLIRILFFSNCWWIHRHLPSLESVAATGGQGWLRGVDISGLAELKRMTSCLEAAKKRQGTPDSR